MAETTTRHFQADLEQLKTRLLEMGGLAEDRVRTAVDGLVRRDPDAVRACHRRRSADQPAAHRDRQPLLHAPGAAPADGGRSPRDRVGGQDQHRSRAGWRPGDQHCRSGGPLHAPRAGQGAHRHPANGVYRPDHAARCARCLRPSRHRARAARPRRRRRPRLR